MKERKADKLRVNLEQTRAFVRASISLAHQLGTEDKLREYIFCKSDKDFAEAVGRDSTFCRFVREATVLACMEQIIIINEELQEHAK